MLIPKEIIDQALVLALVKENGLLLEHFHEYQKDPNVVIEAIQQNPRALEFASDEIKDNLDIVVPAIVKWPDALQFASDRLKNNQGVVLTAIKKSGYAINYASELKQNISFLIKAININNDVILYLDEKSNINKNERLKQLYWEAYRNVYESSRRKMEENLERDEKRLPYRRILGGTTNKKKTKKKTNKKTKNKTKTKRFRDKR